MQLNNEQLELAIRGAVQYRIEDHQTRAMFTDPPPAASVVLYVEAEHLETGIQMQLALHLSPATVHMMATELPAVAEDLRRHGIAPGSAE